MKKIISNTLIALLAFGGTVAYANEGQTGATTSRPILNTEVKNPKLPLPPGQLLKMKEEEKEKLEMKKSSTTDNMRDLKERNASSTKEKLNEMMRRLEHSRFNNMIIRFRATIEREEAIMARIVSRINKVKGEGGDTTKAEKFVSDAKIHLAEASTTLESLKSAAGTLAELEASTTTKMASTTKDSLLNLRKISDELNKHLREAHKALIDAVSNLLGMSSTRPKLHATTTENNTQN